MGPKMPDMPVGKTWRDDPVTPRQVGMIAWLLTCRGIISRPKIGAVSPMDLTKGQANKLIDKLLSKANDEEIIELLKANDIGVIYKKQMERSWQELVVEDIFERSL